MKTRKMLILCLAALVAVFAGCDASGSPAATPVSSIAPAPTPALTTSTPPMLTPTFATTLAPTATPSPLPTLTPTLAPTATPMPTPSVSPNLTPVKFKDAQVQAQVRKMLKKKKDAAVTVNDMQSITSFAYDPVNDRTATGTIKTLDDLRYCINLEQVQVTHQPIRSIEGLRKLKKLTNVVLLGCSVSDLRPLAGKENLREVWISGNPVKDASPVFKLPNLTDFNAMWGTKITDISALRGKHNLKSFYCLNKLTDISPLYGHEGMQNIALSGISNAEFVKMLGAFKGLSYIQIEYSKLKDSSLSLLKDYSLYLLILDHCGIKDISALSELTTVNDLRLTNNKITDISPLANLTQLSYCLDLRGNKIKDLSPLLKLTRLQFLTVTGNPYKNPSVLDKLEKNGCIVQR